MFTLKSVGSYLIKNKNMIWSAILCLVAVVLTLFILNTVLGLLVYYVDSSQSIYWHSLSPYWITVLVLIMTVSVILEFYVFRSGGHSLAKQSQFVGQAIAIDEAGWATIEVKNRFAVGDTLEIIHPSGNQIVVLDSMKRKGAAVDVAAGNGIQVQIPNMHGKEKALVARIIQNS